MRTARIASARQVFLGERPGSPAEQDVLEKTFFKSLSLPNGTHKTTAPGRLWDVDRTVCDLFETAQAVHLLDVGISSGVTTLELLDEFDRRGVRATGVGVDICIRGVLCSRLGIDVLYDPAGKVLQVATPFFARGRPHRTQRSVRSRLLGLGIDFFESSFVRKRLAKPRRARPLDLVSRRLLERPGFQVVERDIAIPVPEWTDSFDLIRAANVLNLDYFSPPQIAAMVTNLTAALKPGGFLVVCRTSAADGTNNGCVYRKSAASPGPRRVHRIGAGYELDSLIDGSPTPDCGGANEGQ